MADIATIDEPARPDPEAAVGDRRPSWSVWWPPEWRSVASVAIVLVAFVLPLRGLFRFQGPPMEEGFMLVFPELVLNGEIPNRDFLHLYGPGSLWALAGFFKVFGTSLASERVVRPAPAGRHRVRRHGAGPSVGPQGGDRRRA